MIVDHLNTVLRGGAFIAARRLHHALLQAGVASRFWHADKANRSAGDPSYHQIRWTSPGAGLEQSVFSFIRAVRWLARLRVAH